MSETRGYTHISKFSSNSKMVSHSKFLRKKSPRFFPNKYNSQQDWKYSAQYLRSSIDQRVTTRSFAWLELKAAPESTITYQMGLSPRQDGWTNFLNLELKRVRVTTSINYGLLTEADGVRVQCDLSNPLKWNALHNWAFNI